MDKIHIAQKQKPAKRRRGRISPDAMNALAGAIRDRRVWAIGLQRATQEREPAESAIAAEREAARIADGAHRERLAALEAQLAAPAGADEAELQGRTP